MTEALHHLHTSCDAYEKQIQQGRYFLHEAPWGATSWKDERVERISQRDDVYVVRGPMCKWGMTAADCRSRLQGTGYVRKETGWMINHPGLGELLENECANKTGEAPWHCHVHLIGGIAQQAAKYPPQLVRAVLKCLKKELDERGELNSVDAYSAGPVPEIPTVDADWEERYIDDVNGGILPAEEVRKARALEMDYLQSNPLLVRPAQPHHSSECLLSCPGPRPSPPHTFMIIHDSQRAKRCQCAACKGLGCFAINMHPPQSVFWICLGRTEIVRSKWVQIGCAVVHLPLCVIELSIPCPTLNTQPF